MNRRDFLKKIGVTCAVAVAAPAALVKAKPKITNRSVIYGQAARIYPKGELMLSMGTELPYGIPYYMGYWRKMGYIGVIVIESIKKGQGIVWHPNGTISGL